MLTILLGDYGSGKTTTAKWLAKQNGGIHLRSEMLVRGDLPLADKLKEIMKPDTDYYLDGWNGNYHYGDLPAILGVKVKYIVCMATPERIRKAQHEKNPTNAEMPRPVEHIKITTQYAMAIATTYDDEPLFADTTSHPVTFWTKEQWLSRWMEINLYSRLKDKGEYQDIELTDRYITGLSQSYKTWQRLDAMVAFRGKSVVDLGCNYGFFCFKAEQAGAINVTGIDISPSALATARSIAMVKNSKVHFVVAELKKHTPPYADIAMALNTLHHLDYDKGLLNLIFQRSNKVILEMPANDKSKVDDVALAYGFNLYVAGSHREGRCILVYNREEKIAIENKYRYHPRREAIKWWFIRTASSHLPFQGLKRRIWRLITR